MGKFKQSLRKLLLSVPLRLKILGLAFALITIFSVITIYQIRQELNVNVDAVLQDESGFVARELSYQARDYLLINDLFGLNRILTNMAENRPDIRYAFIVDSDNNVLAHTFGRRFPLDLLKIDRGPFVDVNNNTSRIVTNEGRVWDTQYAVMPGENKFVRVGVKGDNLRNRFSFLIKNLMRDTFVMALVAGILSLLLSWLIVKPVRQLLAATREIRRGNYNFALQIEAHDEIGHLIKGFNAMARSLEQGEKVRKEKQDLQRDFLHKVLEAQENERKRIARELHDQTGQALASCMVELRLLEQAGTDIDQREGIERLKNAINLELEALHDLAMDLRPSVLDDLGLLPAIEMYIQNFEKRHNMRVRLNVLGDFEQRMDPYLETCVYRIIQESLTNIAKHSKASEASIFLEKMDTIIRGGIEDNGSGFKLEHIDLTKSMGLYGMRERVKLVGGSFVINSDEGCGTMVSFEIPFRQEICHE